MKFDPPFINHIEVLALKRSLHDAELVAGKETRFSNKCIVGYKNMCITLQSPCTGVYFIWGCFVPFCIILGCKVWREDRCSSEAPQIITDCLELLKIGFNHLDSSFLCVNFQTH